MKNKPYVKRVTGTDDWDVFIPIEFGDKIQGIPFPPRNTPTHICVPYGSKKSALNVAAECCSTSIDNIDIEED